MQIVRLVCKCQRPVKVVDHPDIGFIFLIFAGQMLAPTDYLLDGAALT
jgi:hypothetical protein